MARDMRLIIWSLCLWCTVGTSAQSIEVDVLTEVCKVQLVPLYSGQIKPLSKRNRHLYISVEEALKAYQKGKLTIVDVRPPEEYSQFRIPNSINLALHQLTHKTFLKSKALLLVNDGKSYQQLESVAETLENKGFHKVSLIDGGLIAWRDGTQLIDGKSGAVNSLRFMGAKDLVREANHGPWYVVNLGKQGDFTEKINGEIVDLELNSLLAKKLNASIASRAAKLPRVLFVSDDQQVYTKLSDHIDQLDFSSYHILSQTTDYTPEFKKQSRLVYASRNRVSDKGCQL